MNSVPTTDTSLFITETGAINELGDINESIYYCRFDANRYDDSLFDSLGIARPASLDGAVTKRKAEFLAGRYCAKRSLENQGLHGISVGIGRHRSPVWPESAAGSITHCDDLAAAVTLCGKKLLGVGIDIENVVTWRTLDDIIDHVAADHEIELILGQDDEEAALLTFTLLFSAKESLFKAAYPTVGKYFGFEIASLTKVDRHSSTLYLHVNKTLGLSLTCGTLVKVHYRILPRNKVVTSLVLPRVVAR